MAQNDTPRKALVLAGGGARGSYQVGVWRALTELGWNPQIITGTSVGSLNGAMFALDLYETARDMWTSIRSQDVMELPEETRNLTELHQFLRDVVRAGGMDVTPLEEIVERVLDEDALRASPIRFGLVTVEKRGLKPRELPLEEIPKGKVKDYLLASAACFPALLRLYGIFCGNCKIPEIWGGQCTCGACRQPGKFEYSAVRICHRLHDFWRDVS